MELSLFKLCSKCNLEKPYLDYHYDKWKKDGQHTVCSECHSNRNKLKRATDPEFREKDVMVSKTYRDNHRNEVKLAIINANYKKNYGITLDDYNVMLTQQNNVCAICIEPETHIDKRSGKAKRLAVDHNHATGKVRGLLCQSCNVTLGKMKERPDLLRAAAQYLEDR